MCVSVCVCVSVDVEEIDDFYTKDDRYISKDYDFIPESVHMFLIVML